MRTASNFEGQKFGKLCVIKQTENPKNKNKKRKFWLCQCECGEESIVTTSDLKSGKARQCWKCAHADVGKARRKSLIGNKYGKLTVISETYGVLSDTGKQRTKCTCLCDCGKTVIKTREHLFQANLPSCGCARKEIMRKTFGTEVDGLKFGFLTVIKTLWDENPIKLQCKCDCGNEFIGIKGGIVSLKTQSCGCYQRQRASESNEKDWSDYISNYGIKIVSQFEMNSKGQWLWNCICGLCGNFFVALPAKINNGHITSCGCRVRSSREELISKILDFHDICYEREYVFNDCTYKGKLRFDFAIFDTNNNVQIIIEYDGAQHYKPVSFFGGESQYHLTILRDKIKDEYCMNNNIHLLRLPYFLNDEEIKQQILRILNDCGMPVVI